MDELFASIHFRQPIWQYSLMCSRVDTHMFTFRTWPRAQLSKINARSYGTCFRTVGGVYSQVHIRTSTDEQYRIQETRALLTLSSWLLWFLEGSDLCYWKIQEPRRASWNTCPTFSSSSRVRICNRVGRSWFLHHLHRTITLINVKKKNVTSSLLLIILILSVRKYRR